MDDLDKRLDDCGKRFDFYLEKMLEIERALRSGKEFTKEEEEKYREYGDKWMEARDEFIELRKLRKWP